VKNFAVKSAVLFMSRYFKGSTVSGNVVTLTFSNRDARCWFDARRKASFADRPPLELDERGLPLMAVSGPVRTSKI